MSRPGLVVGAPAALFWPVNNSCHFVTVQRLIGDDVEIRFADHETRQVPAFLVTGMAPAGTIRAGDAVMALWRGDRMFPGTATPARRDAWLVAWHDGDAPLVVPASQMTLLEWVEEGRPAFDAVMNADEPEWLDVSNAVVVAQDEPMDIVEFDDGASTGAAATGAELVIYLPGAIEPVERGERFADPIDAALMNAGVGEIIGEGTRVGERWGSRFIAGCDISVRVTDVPRAMGILATILTDRGAPAGTTISEGKRVLRRF